MTTPGGPETSWCSAVRGRVQPGAAAPPAMETWSTDFEHGVGGTAHRAAAAGRSGNLQHRHSARPVAGLYPVVGGRDNSGRRSTGTDSAIQPEVFAGKPRPARRDRRHVQPDLEKGTANWYVMDAPVPFTAARRRRAAGPCEHLGDDAWKLNGAVRFRLDTASGRPNQVVSLVSLPIWGPRG